VNFHFQKQDRLLKRVEFLNLSETGRTEHSSYFLAVFAPGRFQHCRLGVTVSKKVGNSVTRNRIRRYVREFFRQHRHCIAGIWDINIIAKKRAADASSHSVCASLRQLFDKISRVGYQTDISAID
jgi:ribonuclease P protein component